MKKEEPTSESPAAPSQAPQRRLLPALATHPLTLLITVVVPQLILLVINLRAYHLLSEEIDESQAELALTIFAAQLVILVGGSLFALWQWRRTRHIRWRWNWVIFLPPVAYLSWFSVKIMDIVPDALQTWIVQPETMIFYQFVFLMPAVFLSALGLACFPIRISAAKDVGASLGVAVGIPLLWYLLLRIGNSMWFWDLPGNLLFLMVTVTSLLCLTAVLRLITLLFTWALRKGPVGQALLIALVSIAAPIGGLLLNREIPFPSDFQVWPIYLLTVLNGLALTTPKFNRPRLDRTVWLIQCFFFPFSLYFFFIFLPYLPLAAVAIIAAGAGFLVLSPTALFVIHLRKLHQGNPGRKFLAYGILAALLLPAYAQVEMLIDRQVLHRAIDYVYSPNLDNGGRFRGSRMALRRSLMRLQQVKKGIYMPFLTEWYNRAVLDGLVLNDEKMNHLHSTFFGKPIPESKAKPGLALGWQSNRSSAGRRMNPPPSDAVLKKVTHSTTSTPGEGTRTLVKLELHNPNRWQSEFATSIILPEGVFVSGYWLNVEGQRVPGRIFEKKTAMWIYRMIRDATRRDPGLLTYAAPDRLSLRVFPFAVDETRTTEIEFLSPPGYSPEIRIGEEIVRGDSETDAIVKSEFGVDHQAFFIPAEAAAKLPGTNREPFLHFLVDRSIDGLSAEEAIASMKEVVAKFPRTEGFTVATANYEFTDTDWETRPVDGLGGDDTKSRIESLPLRGGFLEEHTIKRALNHFRKHQADSADPDEFLRFPLLVLITRRPTPKEKTESLSWFRSVTPDVEGFYRKTHETDSLTAIRFDGGETGKTHPIKPVLILSSGEKRAIVLAGETAATAVFPSRETLEVFDAESGRFQPVGDVPELPAESAYAKAVETGVLESRMRWNPSRTGDLLSASVRRSRETGILTPSTAYIVVENSAQWKLLKRKEKEKLKGNQALDYMEAPEPHLFLVALIFGLFLFAKRRWGGSSTVRDTAL